MLVRFIITFSTSGTYQYCYFMLGVPTVQENLSWTRFWEKEKVKDKIVGCDFLIHFAVFFSLVVNCKTWCSVVVGMLKGFIFNLGCAIICP